MYVQSDISPHNGMLKEGAIDGSMDRCEVTCDFVIAHIAHIV